MCNHSPSLPIVRLRPKVDSRPFRWGMPWVYADQIVTDRRTKSIAPGSIAQLLDQERNPLCLVTVNPDSKIIARVLDRDPQAMINRDWVAHRIRVAQEYRARFFDAPFYRLVHAEADGLPGVIIDRFGDHAVIQPNAIWAEHALDDIVAALVDVTSVNHVIKNAASRARTAEKLDANSAVLRGRVEAPVAVPMNGAIYMADLIGGQKTGLFYDQRPNHGFFATMARERRVLDVFSHVGGFSLAALAHGASQALAIDGSALALGLAQEGAQAMKAEERFSSQQGDAFAVMEALAAESTRFDDVVCDPPAFAPRRETRPTGLRAYQRVARMAAPLVADYGTLTLCSCSHAADLASFRDACIVGIGRAGRQAQLLRTGFAGPDHPLHPHLSQNGYLKTLTFRLLP